MLDCIYILQDDTRSIQYQVYSFIIDLRKGKRIEEKRECKHKFANRTQCKKFTTCSYFCIQFGQDKQYFLTGMGTERDCGLLSVHCISYTDSIRKLFSWPAKNRMHPSKRNWLLQNNNLIYFSHSLHILQHVNLRILRYRNMLNSERPSKCIYELGQ